VEHYSGEILRDLYSAFGQLQLEPANIIGGGGLRRASEKGGKPLAAPDVSFLRLRVQLASRHVIDHALAKGTDITRTHGKLLSGLRLTPQSQDGAFLLSAKSS
jgi:hypothetical protein